MVMPELPPMMMVAMWLNNYDNNVLMHMVTLHMMVNRARMHDRLRIVTSSKHAT
jgi:hypothetical protein